MKQVMLPNIYSRRNSLINVDERSPSGSPSQSVENERKNFGSKSPSLLSVDTSSPFGNMVKLMAAKRSNNASPKNLVELKTPESPIEPKMSKGAQMILSLQKNLDEKLNLTDKKKSKNKSPFEFDFDNEALNSRLSILVERFASRAVKELDSKNVYKSKIQHYGEKFKEIYE